VKQGQPARALEVLKEAYDAGIDTFDQVERDEAMAPLRNWPDYQKYVKRVDDESLAKARQMVKNFLDKPLEFPFDFHLEDIDGKPLSLDQYKGKVLLIDIWGTWCKPCRDAIPGLIQLYRKHHRRGFEIVGLALEHTSSPEDARTLVKQGVQALGIPYRCGLIDEEFVKKIPGFNSFPTTLVLDRSGKVRLLVTQNTQNLPAALDAFIHVLTAEATATTPPKPAGADPKTKSPAKPR
jgi:thiol-disulfide isomerase/thioredoxin